MSHEPELTVRSAKKLSASSDWMPTATRSYSTTKAKDHESGDHVPIERA